jgi:hypothetical protein
VNEVAGKASEAISTLDDAYADIYRSHPFLDSPDFVARVRSLLADGRITAPLELR